MIRIMKEDLRIHWSLIRHLIRIAWPASFQFVIASGSWIILSALIARYGGTAASAGYQIAMRNIIFFILPAWGLSNAAATLVGQNLGAGKPDRAEHSVRLCAIYNSVFMAMVTFIFLIFANPIVSFFTTEPAVKSAGILALRIIGAGFVFYGLGMVMTQALNGAGDTRTPTVINIVCFWLFQVPLAWYLCTETSLNTTGVFLAIPLAESLIALLAFFYFKKGKWKLQTV
jgi:Na+-driven multidrug efflux pump